MEVGTLCVKIAGRDAGMTCVVVDIVDKNFVMVDGQTRRRKCNIIHLEPIDEKLKIKKGATHEEVVAEFKKKGLVVKERKSKPKTERPRKIRKVKENPKKQEKKKKEEKKVEVKEEKKSKPKLKVTKKE